MGRPKIDVRKKGKRFERRIAAFFSDIFGVCIKRTPNSGAIQEFVRVDLYAPELMKLGKLFILAIECKHEEQLTLLSLIRGKSSVFNSWIKQVERSVEKGQYPCIVFTKNNHPDFIAIPSINLYDLLTDSFTLNFLIVYKNYRIILLEDFYNFLKKDIQNLYQKDTDED